MSRKTQVSEKAIEQAARHEKAFFMRSSWYSHRRSELAILLEESRGYSVCEVEQLLCAPRNGVAKSREKGGAESATENDPESPARSTENDPGSPL